MERSVWGEENLKWKEVSEQNVVTQSVFREKADC
jgi:hypothetical protein